MRNQPLSPALPRLPAVKARGQTKTGVMNKTEARYSEQLRARMVTGEVAWFEYESQTFLLAPDTRYTPDFAVLLTDGTMEFHEVKGFWRDDAWVKIKVAAAKFPYVFRSVLWDKDRGTWTIEQVG